MKKICQLSQSRGLGETHIHTYHLPDYVDITNENNIRLVVLQIQFHKEIFQRSWGYAGSEKGMLAIRRCRQVASKHHLWNQIWGITFSYNGQCSTSRLLSIVFKNASDSEIMKKMLHSFSSFYFSCIIYIIWP